MMAHAGSLRRLAAHFASRGLAAYALDFRGHGASKPPTARTHSWTFRSYVDYDLPAAIAAISAHSGHSPASLSYLGHSLGGLAGLASFGTGTIPLPRRLVLVAVNCWTRPRPWRQRLAAATLLASSRIGYAPARALRVGAEDEPRAYIADMARWLRHGFSSPDLEPYAAQFPRITAPTLAVVSDGDWMCTPADSREFLAPLSPRWRCVGPLRGDALAPDHMGLVTSNALAPLWDDLADFLLTP